MILRYFRSVLTSAPSTRSSRSRRSSRPRILERYHIISLKHLLATTELPTRPPKPALEGVLLKTPALKKVFRALDLNVTKLLYTAPIVHRQPEWDCTTDVFVNQYFHLKINFNRGTLWVLELNFSLLSKPEPFQAPGIGLKITWPAYELTALPVTSIYI